MRVRAERNAKHGVHVLCWVEFKAVHNAALHLVKVKSEYLPFSPLRQAPGLCSIR